MLPLNELKHDVENGSIDTGTAVTPSFARSVCVAMFTLRWKTTPWGKFAAFGLLFAQKTP